MAESVYKVLELIGTSTESWERAATAAVERAAETLRELRVAEVVEQDMQIADGKVEAFRVKLKVSFKYEGAQRSRLAGREAAAAVRSVHAPPPRTSSAPSAG